MLRKEKVIKNGKVITPFDTIENGVVLINEGKIVAVGSHKEIDIPEEAEIIDARGKIIIPGFIDIHMHGALKYDVREENSIKPIASFLSRFGTTGFLPTLIPLPLKRIFSFIDRAKRFRQDKDEGAQILGIHLEGPYINPNHSGALPKEYLREIIPDEFKDIIRKGTDILKIMTLSPEIRGASELTEALAKNNIVPSVGHSSATLKQIDECTKKGLKHATHLFNVMPRQKVFEGGTYTPGLIEAILTHDELTADIVVDAEGIHVHPMMMKILIKCKGVEKVTLITDSMKGTGLPKGTYALPDGRKAIIGDSDVCRLENGDISGSLLTMNVAVRNMINLIGISLPEGILMATHNPAKVIGVNDRKGSIATGKDADIAIIDEDFNVYLTMVEGKIIYSEGN